MIGSSGKKEFLRANWFKLASANYIVDPNRLLKHVPYGTELDFYKGNCYISLVAFRYCETRLKKVKVPFHHQFEEMNLRFYLKREIAPGKWRSGVAFTKLFFPKPALTLVARSIYKEDYTTSPMRHEWRENGEDLDVSYSIKNGTWHDFEIAAKAKSSEIKANTDEEFFNEHYWGYSQIDESSSTEYDISHPKWKVHPIRDFNVNLNFKSVFGKEYDFLNEIQPESVQLSEGSRVIVNEKKILRK